MESVEVSGAQIVSGFMCLVLFKLSSDTIHVPRCSQLRRLSSFDVLLHLLSLLLQHRLASEEMSCLPSTPDLTCVSCHPGAFRAPAVRLFMPQKRMAASFRRQRATRTTNFTPPLLGLMVLQGLRSATEHRFKKLAMGPGLCVVNPKLLVLR